MAGDWRISAEERRKYETYFQQCAPVQGFLSGDKAREFFVKSSLPADILRRIWDLADITVDGRLDKREFAIACHLISSQVQKKGPLPVTLPAALLSDALTISSNGVPSISNTRPFNYLGAPSQPLIANSLLKPAVVPLPALTPSIRSKYLQRFHSLVDVTKTNGFMSGLQARNILQQTALSQTLLRQIWDLADHDGDGRFTPEEFVVAMHCCDIARAGQSLPSRLPEDWSPTTTLSQRSASLTKPPTFALLNRDLQETLKSTSDEESLANEIERKNSIETYEEKRRKNHEDGYKELERRRQLLREQEERDIREREEREQKRELELQRQKEEQERRKQLEFERQLERQRQIEQHKEDERKKLFEQREAARKEMERKSRLEWERQRMQELSTQKSRLLEQINDLKSREKALGLEVQKMDDTTQTGQNKLQQSNVTIQTLDQSIADLQQRVGPERNLCQSLEQQRRDLSQRLSQLRVERESINASFKQLDQSKEFSTNQRDSEQVRFVQAQIESIKQENTRVDEQISAMNNQCRQYQNQMETLRSQLAQLEQEAKTKSTLSSMPSPPVISKLASTVLQAPMANVARPAVLDDPFRTVDPFASPSDLGSPSQMSSMVNDPFVSSPTVARPSPQAKKHAPKLTPKVSVPTNAWGEPANGNSGAQWPPKSSSSFDLIQYRALYDYTPVRPDEIAMAAGDLITVDPKKGQQDENWLFGKTGNGQEGFFPAAYAEQIGSPPPIDTTSTLPSDSWVIALADCQGKTADKHLSCQKGDLILVQKQKDVTWYSGQLRGKIGWFPRNYVRPATEVEIRNEKNAFQKASVNSPTSPSSASLSDNSVADVYEAVYAYEATDPADLSFNVGERITVLQNQGEWWTGRIGERTGTFPHNYVQRVENPLQETAVAIAPFQTHGEGRLLFDPGQLIYIRKKGDKGWYQGEIRTPDQPIRVGWFPAQCVQLQSLASPSTAYQNTPEIYRYVAIFPYQAQQDDELSFPVDAILEVFDRTSNSNWFKARLGQQSGLIPSTYVQPVDERQPSSSVHSRLLPRPPYPADSTIITTSSDGETSISIPSPSLPSNPSRVSAIRELIETEQRYVDDLQIVAQEFIQPLNYLHVLNDYETKQLFINWQNLIECNTVLLLALKEQVDYKEQTINGDVTLRAPRSVSMSNIALAAQTLPNPSKTLINHRHRSFTPDVSQSPSIRRLKHRGGTHRRSPSSHALAAKATESPTESHPPFSSPGSMTITDDTKIGQILCDHLPGMGDDYFQYCNSRAQANKYLQTKIESNEQFRTYLNTFQDRTGGLSLNGFLTKPIQRVTRYPLLIEKVFKHTSSSHSDYQAIKEAMDCARQLNELINKQISEQESNARLDWLQQHLIFGSDDSNADGYLFDECLKFNSLTKYQLPRQLLLHGLVIKMPGGKELLAFLFNDFLLFCTMKSSSSHWQSQLFDERSYFQLKLYRMPLFLTDIVIANDALNDQLTFSITTKIYDKPLLLKTQQTNVRTLWVKAINNAVEECQAAERSILTDKAMFAVSEVKRDFKAAVARLLLVVQEAHDLMPSKATLDRHRSLDPYCEITVDSLTLRTPFIKRTIAPKWNAPMQFLLYNFFEDVIHINLFDHEFFAPNENLGSTSIRFVDILPCSLESFFHQPSLPFTQKLFLNNGSSVMIKFVVQLLAPTPSQ